MRLSLQLDYRSWSRAVDKDCMASEREWVKRAEEAMSASLERTMFGWLDDLHYTGLTTIYNNPPECP